MPLYFDPAYIQPPTPIDIQSMKGCQKTKTRMKPITFKSDRDQFAEIDFVHNMNEKQLKQTLLKLWQAMDAIANEFEDAVPQVTQSIDGVKDALRYGGQWKVENAPKRIQYYNSGNNLIQVDIRNNAAHLYNPQYGASLLQTMTTEQEVLKKFPQIK